MNLQSPPIWTLFAAAILLGNSLRAGCERNAVLDNREEQLASKYAGSWGLTSGTGFLEVVGEKISAASALGNPQYRSLVLAVLGSEKPRRRSGNSTEGFIDTSSMEPILAVRLGLTALNRGAGVLEAATGKTLFPMKLIPVAVALSESRRPFALWEVSSGNVFIDQRVLEHSGSLTSAAQKLLETFAEALPHQMKAFTTVQDNATSQADQSALLPSLVSKAVPAALAVAVATQIPLWFCIACPVVLGLLAPFAFNLGFGSAANMICEHYQLPAQECNDLWYGAFALAMVLSLASAIPIVYICQLPKCGRR